MAGDRAIRSCLGCCDILRERSNSVAVCDLDGQDHTGHVENGKSWTWRLISSSQVLVMPHQTDDPKRRLVQTSHAYTTPNDKSSLDDPRPTSHRELCQLKPRRHVGPSRSPTPPLYPARRSNSMEGERTE